MKFLAKMSISSILFLAVCIYFYSTHSKKISIPLESDSNELISPQSLPETRATPAALVLTKKGLKKQSTSKKQIKTQPMILSRSPSSAVERIKNRHKGILINLDISEPTIPGSNYHEVRSVFAVRKSKFEDPMGEKVGEYNGFVLFKSDSMDPDREIGVFPVVTGSGGLKPLMVTGNIIIKGGSVDIYELARFFEIDVVYSAPHIRTNIVEYRTKNLAEIFALNERIKKYPNVTGSKVEVLHGRAERQ